MCFLKMKPLARTLEASDSLLDCTIQHTSERRSVCQVRKPASESKVVRQKCTAIESSHHCTRCLNAGCPPKNICGSVPEHAYSAVVSSAAANTAQKDMHRNHRLNVTQPKSLHQAWTAHTQHSRASRCSCVFMSSETGAPV